MHFMFRKEWVCQALKEDLKMPLPRQVRFTDEEKTWEMAQRGGFIDA